MVGSLPVDQMLGQEQRSAAHDAFGVRPEPDVLRVHLDEPPRTTAFEPIGMPVSDVEWTL
jgi:hypothetical protein